MTWFLKRVARDTRKGQEYAKMFLRLLSRAMLISFVSGQIVIAQPVTTSLPPLKIITADQYLKLNSDFQAAYLAGVLDGMSFMLYSVDSPERAKWTACVRKTTLGEFVNELARFLEKHPEEKAHPLPWPISRVIGERRPCE